MVLEGLGLFEQVFEFFQFFLLFRQLHFLVLDQGLDLLDELGSQGVRLDQLSVSVVFCSLLHVQADCVLLVALDWLVGQLGVYIGSALFVVFQVDLKHYVSGLVALYSSQINADSPRSLLALVALNSLGVCQGCSVLRF